PGSQPLSGKTGTFTVVVKDVKEERLPELNNEFAREVGEGFPSIQALRQHLEDRIRERLDAEAEERYRDEALEALAGSVEELEFPPVMAEREIDHILRDQARSVGKDLDRYLESVTSEGQAVEEIREALRPTAEERVRRSLVLTALAEAEQLKVEPSEVDGEIERVIGSSGAQAPQMKQLFDSPGGREAIERSLLTRKTLDRLIEVASGPEPVTKKKTPRAKKPKAKATKVAEEERT
ncbi:MAG: hypothetical protein V3S20_06010, partial [Dehalococcoidia bacterium]